MKKLQLSDLSVGDWVRWNDKTYRVCVIDGVSLTVELAEELGGTIEVAIDELIGIPLTPEILEKNGFKRSAKYTAAYRVPYVWRFGRRMDEKVIVNLFVEGESDEVVLPMPRIRGGGYTLAFILIRFVHELQHALRLAGFEKEIEL